MSEDNYEQKHIIIKTHVHLQAHTQTLVELTKYTMGITIKQKELLKDDKESNFEIKWYTKILA